MFKGQRARWVLGVALALTGCEGTDGPAAASQGFGPIEGPAASVAFAAAYDQMVALTARASFGRAQIGDLGVISSGATTPSDPGTLASLYYETGGLRAAVEGARERRPGRTRNDQVGSRAASIVALELTLGEVSETPEGQRNSPRWRGTLATRTLDQVLWLQAWEGLSERSAAGFDRAVGYLVDASGAPHGLGALLVAGDAACGGQSFQAVTGALASVRSAFEGALAEKGVLDALDRRRIEPGDSPEYEAALVIVDKALVQGVGAAFLGLMAQEPFDAAAQAAALGAFGALMADLEGFTPEGCAGEGRGVDRISRTLDAAAPGDVDRDLVACVITEGLGISPCGG